MREDFYASVLRAAGVGADDTVLAVCAGDYDRRMLLQVGVKHATISNLAHHQGVSVYEPYPWAREDAENLSFDDRSFDWVCVNAGLHHCGSPHRALCEMLRVARKGVIVIESRDSLLMRTAVAAGLTRDYELEPAAIANGVLGGYRGGAIPNYVYRWKEREVEKTVNTFLPQYKNTITYHYRYRVPLDRVEMSGAGGLKRGIARIGASMAYLGERLAPKQANLFGFVVRTGEELQPWIKQAEGELKVDIDYLNKVVGAKFQTLGANRAESRVDEASRVE